MSVVKRLTHQTVNLTVQVQVLSLTLEMNCSHAGILLFKIDSSYNGIIAVSKTVETGSIPVGSVFAGLAQLAEHLICNQGVTGSSPVIGIAICRELSSIAQLVRAHA